MRILTIIFLLAASLPGQSAFPVTQYGNGSAGPTDYVPTLHTEGRFPVLGNSGFQVVSRNLTGQSSGFLWLSSQSANFSLLGLTLYVNPSAGIGIPTLADGLLGKPGDGMTTIPLPVPNDLALAGADIFLQAFSLPDPTQVVLTHTQGLHLQIWSTMSSLLSVLHDRKAYQAFFQGVTPSQADGLGKGIWAANAVAGFSYLRTQYFFCGGESHWMVIVKHDGTGIEFMVIPGDSYRMGDINNSDKFNNKYYAKPVHWAHIEPFLIARTEVSQSQFEAVLFSTPWLGQVFVKIGPNYAANYIDWDNAVAFCAKLGWRLPSESEWEYACRAGTTSDFYYGENIIPTKSLMDQYAWFDYNSHIGGQPGPCQVGQKLSNAFGLCDMHGNVCEWCQDKWYDSLIRIPTNGKPNLSGVSSNRSCRGGCWSFSGEYCASLSRGCRNYPGIALPLNGFRPAKSLR